MKRVTLTIEDGAVHNLRVDRFIADNLRLLTRSQLKSRSPQISVNGAPVKLSKLVSAGDNIVIEYDEPQQSRYTAEPIPLDILFENETVIVINKPQGLVVHPAAGNHTGTLVQGLLYHCRELRQGFDQEEVRPGIVHRLDKDTSGVIITAKNSEIREKLAAQFRRRKTEKKYYAVVMGRMPGGSGCIDAPIARDPRFRKRFAVSTETGKPALTHYKVLATFADTAFIALRPTTGRTHQLRVHLKHIGHPILGDPIYARRNARFPDATLMLHAYSLRIKIPGCEEPLTFRAPLPAHFKRMLLQLSTQTRDS